MTARTVAQLDPILSTRLELLEQVLDEVQEISDAVIGQQRRLREIEERLRPEGMLSASEKNLLLALNDAQSRLDIVLRLERGSSEDDETRPGGTTSGLSMDDETRLRDAHTSLEKGAHDALTQFHDERLHAHQSFVDVQRWSIAGLDDQALTVAAKDYRQLLSRIRKSEEPWKRYQQELRGHGQQLFTRYLELLGGMAVRGLRADVMDDVHDLASLLLPPEAPKPSASQLRSHLPMGTKHPPLGYPEWNMWTLPLCGRWIAEKLIKDQTFETSIPPHLQVHCADVYLLHVLGPSYAFAAIFIGLEPDDAPVATSSDSARAQVIIEQLTHLDESEPLQQSLAKIAGRLAQPWSQARSAFGCRDIALDQADQRIVGDYFMELRTDFADAAYDAKRLSSAEDLSRQLIADDGKALNKAKPNLRDLLTAIWLARLDYPDRGRQIHKAASSVRRRWYLAGAPLDWRRQPRLGL